MEPVLDAIAKGEVKVLASLGEQFPGHPALLHRGHRDRDQEPPRRAGPLRSGRTIEGLRWAQANPEEAANLAVKHIRETPLPVLTQGMKEMARTKVYGVDGGISEKGLQDTQQALKDLGRIKTVAKSTEVAALDLLQDALKLLGPAK